jgi:hypothetical protein
MACYFKRHSGEYLDPSVYNLDFEGGLTLNKKAARAFLSPLALQTGDKNEEGFPYRGNFQSGDGITPI